MLEVVVGLVVDDTVDDIVLVDVGMVDGKLVPEVDDVDDVTVVVLPGAVISVEVTDDKLLIVLIKGETVVRSDVDDAVTFLNGTVVVVGVLVDEDKLVDDEGVTVAQELIGVDGTVMVVDVALVVLAGLVVVVVMLFVVAMVVDIVKGDEAVVRLPSGGRVVGPTVEMLVGFVVILVESLKDGLWLVT